MRTASGIFLFAIISFCNFPVARSFTFQELEVLLYPIEHKLNFHILANMSSMRFRYQLDMTIKFRLIRDAPALSLHCGVRDLKILRVVHNYNKSHPVNCSFQRNTYFLAIHKPKFETMKAGVYEVTAHLEAPIYNYHGLGIMYTVHMDALTKGLTHSIWMDFQPHRARYVMLTLSNVNAKSKISTTITHNSLDKYHAYFVRQSSFRTEDKNITTIKMFDVDLPIGFFVLYLSQTVRTTKGTPNFSATITTTRNHVGKFKEQFRYILDIFYRYVEKYQTFGPKKLPLQFPDVFLHLHENLTDMTMARHSTCVVSTPFLVMHYMNHKLIHEIMARCMASNHIMTRRFPVYWSSFYIQNGLVEYYTSFLQMKADSDERRMDDFSGLGTDSVKAFGQDDVEAYSMTIGVESATQSFYVYLNTWRMLCFVNMLKHLIPHDKANTFDAIVSDFMTQQDNYNRSDFMRSYQTITENQIFSSDLRINWFFDRWTMQSAYPILVVQREGQRLYFHQTISPHFKRLKPKPFMIPINIVLESRAVRDLNKTHPDLWMLPNTSRVYFDIKGVCKWYLVNNQRASYYRVFYDPWNYKRLRFELLRGNINRIAPVTRGQILDDLLFFGERGYMGYEQVLELLEVLKVEVAEIPWKVITFQLIKFKRFLMFTPSYELFQKFMEVLTYRFYTKQVEQSSSYPYEALKWACFAKSERCLRTTHKLFLDYLQFRQSHEHIDSIVCEGIKSADDRTVLFMKMNLYQLVRGLEHDLYLKGFSCSHNYKYLMEILNVIFRWTSPIPWLSSIDKARHMERMSEHPEGIRAVVDFMFVHPDLVLQNLGERQMVSLLQTMAKSLHKRGHERKVRSIIKLLGLNNTKRIFDEFKRKRKWLSKHRKQVYHFLKNYDYDREMARLQGN